VLLFEGGKKKRPTLSKSHELFVDTEKKKKRKTGRKRPKLGIEMPIGQNAGKGKVL